MSRRRILVGTIAALALLTPLSVTGPAAATYPGSDGRVAFGLDRDPSLASPDIYTVRPDGRGLRRLTRHPAADICPNYSADGTAITFCSNRTGTYQIFVMKADGRNKRRLTSLDAGGIFPDFSPDGHRIVFQGLDGDLYTVGRRFGRLTKLTSGPAVEQYPSYSPDGTKIAYVSNKSGVNQVWVMRSDGSHPRQLTFGGAPKGQVPDWSPDGERIAYQSAATGGGDIYVMNADGTQQMRVTRSPKLELGPSWSPDGGQIAYLRSVAPTVITGRNIYVVNADGTRNHLLAHGTRVPAWQPL
jgi:Tol biopolymer transport system component